MSNNCIISTKDRGIGIYVHNYGDLDTIAAVLTFCKIKEFPPPEKNSNGWACLIAVMTNLFADVEGEGVIVDLYENLDSSNLCNGHFIIENWEIVEMSRPDDIYVASDEYLQRISEAQPRKFQLGAYGIINRSTYEIVGFREENESTR